VLFCKHTNQVAVITFGMQVRSTRQGRFKGIVHLIINILSSFTAAHVVEDRRLLWIFGSTNEDIFNILSSFLVLH